MEHLQGYNDAVTKLKVLLEDTGSNPESIKHRSSQTNKRKESLVKRWGSQEDLLHSSNQSKRELRELVSHQEDYIGQLEEELGFCRDQLNGMLAKIRQTTLSQSQESQDAIVKLKNENEVLKKSIDAKCENLKRDNVWLVNAVQGLKEETMELQRRETEAVEQVRQSVHMAEQISLEKTQLDMELGQAKQQLERQGDRMKSLVEDHFEKLQETRKSAEERCKEEMALIKIEAEEHANQLVQLNGELERSRRKEQELRRQLSEQKSLSDRLQEESDTRCGQLQLEMVQLRSANQQLDHQLSCLKVDYDHCSSDLESQQARTKSEVESLKVRLARTQELLDESRSQIWQMGEAKGELERENKLLKQSTIANQDRDQDPPATLQQLRMVVQKQRTIIDDYRSQCTDLATKLEKISSSYSDQVAKLSHQLGHCLSQMQVMEGQSQQYGSMYEQCCRKIQDLEREKLTLQEELNQLQHTKPLKRLSSATNQRQHDKYQREAIVVEQNGLITSPLLSSSAKNRN